MSNNIIPIGQAKMPASLRARQQAGKTTSSNFSGGIRDSFPLLSIKGKVFRIRKDGVETPLVDPQTRQVIPFLDVVMVNAAAVLSKTYYTKGFEDGEFQQPDCWSLDSVKPDPSVVNKVSPTCANCPMNAFGSAASQDPSGAKRGGKACSDSKRIAVMFPGQLGQQEPLVFMMRVPATSLKNLKAYSDLLARQGWEPGACVTRLQFDYQQAYPKLEFHFVDSLDDQEYDEVVKQAEGPYVASMLAAPDFDAGVSHPPVNPAVQPRMRQATPVLDETQTVTEKQQQQPAQQPAQQEAEEEYDEEDFIELPDNKWFNKKTGEYVDGPPAVKAKPPVVDPDVLELPDGKFFNRKTKQYVTGNEVGAPPVTTEEPHRRRRTAPKKEAVEASAAPQTPPAPEPEAQEVKPNGAQTEIRPTSAEVDKILGSIMPPRK